MFLEILTKAFLARVMPLPGTPEVHIRVKLNLTVKGLLEIQQVEPPLRIESYGWGWKMEQNQPFFNEFPGCSPFGKELSIVVQG